MILLSAIANITSNLDVIRKQDGKTISSHVKLKEEALCCLGKLLEQAPINEYKTLLESKNGQILIGYLMSVLCELAKCDKSRSIRQRSLEVMCTLVEHLGQHHASEYSSNKCAISPLILALPGVSSTLFKIIMSDTKLNHNILITAIKNLTNLLRVCFLECNHVISSQDSQSPECVPTVKLEDDYLNETCDNLSARIRIMLEYIMNNSANLHPAVGPETLRHVEGLISSHRELMRRLIQPIIRYVANQRSQLGESENSESEILIEAIERQLRLKLQNGSDSNMDMSVLNCLFRILERLEDNAISMLFSERQTELAALHGTLTILTPSSLTTFLELPQRREQFLALLTQLTDFNTDHPLLFLTDTQVNDQALELRCDRVYTIEKQFTHLSDREAVIIRQCCRLIGSKTSWLMLSDLLKNDLIDFDNPSRLFLAHHVIEGLFERNNQEDMVRFSRRMVRVFTLRVQEDFSKINAKLDDTYTKAILKTVLAIETLSLLIELHMKHCADKSAGVVILRDLLCPLLNWCSSKSRAISEVSLNTLTKISQIYGFQSTKDFIQHFTDYIVNGVALMLDNFACNPEVTNVLAITFKLSSIEVFYYFNDIYQRLFRLLEVYHYTECSKSIMLLFYRTLSILCDWKEAKSGHSSDGPENEEIPLMSKASVKAILQEIDIGYRLKKLQQNQIEAENLRLRMGSMQVDAEKDEKETLSALENEVPMINPEEDSREEKKQLSKDLVLTENILKHCVGLMSSSYAETKILALKTAACGFRILSDEEDTLLPLVHQLWPPLISRLTGDYQQNLEINLCAFECLASMALYSGDFIKRRTLDCVIPRLCLFLEAQAKQSCGKKDYEPYCMTMAYKCQLKLLAHLGPLAQSIQLAYGNLWRVVQVALLYLDPAQADSLRQAARKSLLFMLALDADCVWYYAKQTNHLHELPFELIYDNRVQLKAPLVS